VSTAWESGARAIAIDPAAPAYPTPGVRFLVARAEEILPAAVDALTQ